MSTPHTDYVLQSCEAGLHVELYEGVALTLGCAGADRLKEALAALGLKTGGTLRQRAERLWLTRGAPLEVLDKKHFAKGAAPAAARTPEQTERQVAAAKQAALLEAKVGLAHPEVSRST